LLPTGDKGVFSERSTLALVNAGFYDVKITWLVISTPISDKLELDQPILIDEGVQYQTFPVIKIGLLAADKRAKGAGRRLVEWASM
jgi:hypothetical protein